MSIAPPICHRCMNLKAACTCESFILGEEKGRFDDLNIPCDAALGDRSVSRQILQDRQDKLTFRHNNFVAVLKNPFTPEEERVMHEYLDFIEKKRNDSKGEKT